MKRSSVEKHFDTVAGTYDAGKEKYSFYYSNLKKLLGNIISKNSKVLEIGCGTGDLLASLTPKYGVGYDISSKMVALARKKYGRNKKLHFTHQLSSISSQSFDFVFMSDVIEHLENPEEMFKKIHGLMNKKTKFINTMANPIWEPLLMFWEKMGWKMKEGKHRRIKERELRLLYKNAGMKVVSHNYKLLFPINIPLVTSFVNKYLEKYFKKYAFIEIFISTKK